MLRIGLTDRCNLRCVYCMPASGLQCLPAADLLSAEEIVEVVRAAAEIHGIRRIKLTGGEPTVRPDLARIVAAIRGVAAIEDISLTTNGVLLEKLAAPLRAAGLDRVTVSVDSLRPERFREITRIGDLSQVLGGLDRVIELGFAHTKINCVVMRQVNDDEVADFARLTLHYPLSVRFIEYMPLGDAAILHAANCMASARRGPASGCGAQLRPDVVLVRQSEIRQTIERELSRLVPIARSSESGLGPAEMYQLSHGDPPGRIGFISAMSSPFCESCNRLRLTAAGALRSCLFEGGEVDVARILRGPGGRDERQAQLATAMTHCVQLKPPVHAETGTQQMSRVGG